MSDTTGTPSTRGAGRAPATARPPAGPRPHVDRPAAAGAIRRGLDATLLRVVAPPGYGKTAALADAVRADGAAVAWVAASDRTCRRWPARVLAAALGGAAEEPGGTRHERPGASAGRLLEAIAAGWAGDRPPLLVVDDAHLLDARGAAEVAALADGAGGVARLAVAGRWLPALLGDPRPDAVRVAADDLRATPAECHALLRALGGDPSPEEAAEACHEAEGWIAGVVLAARPGGDAHGYLLREGLDALPDAEAATLYELRVLERFTPAMAVAVTGRADAGELLASARARGAFLVDVPGRAGWLRHHRMMRAAMEARARGRPDGYTRALHRRAARAWLDVGEPETAARHHLAGGDLDAAVDALAPLAHGDDRRRPMRDLLGAVPARAWSDAPGAVLARASDLFYRADHERAFDAMERAARELTAGGDRRRAAVVLVRLLRAAPLAGGLYPRTIATARELLPRIGRDAVLAPAALTMLGLVLGESCQYAEAEAELEAAVEQAAGDELVRARVEATRAFAIDHPQGRAGAAMRALEGALPVLRERAGDDVLDYALYAMAFRSVMLADAGRHAEALEAADAAEATAREVGLARLGGPVAVMLRLVPLAGLGRMDALGTELARGRPGARRLAGALRSYRHDVAAAQLAARAGDREGLLRAVRAARVHMDRHGQPYDAAMAMCDLSAAARAGGQHEMARVLADRARERARRAGAPWAAVRAAMAAAVAWGPGEIGDEALGEALRRSADPAVDDVWAARERPLADGLLARARARGIGSDRVARRIAAAIAAADAAPAAVPGDEPSRERIVPLVDVAVPRAPALRLVTLGGFAVERDGAPLDDRQFARRKARVLLAVLACARGPVDREWLCELLWPELPADRGVAALHSTLHSLRRALDPPGAGRGGTSSIVADGTAYRLAVGRMVSWDAAEFVEAAARAAAATGEDALRARMAAEPLYTGTLLPEWPAAAWAREVRAEVEEVHRRLVARIADALSAAGEHADAISRYRLLLAMEPEREAWHRALMRVYAAAGERALALRQYHACRDLLRDALGIEPSRETRDLHTRILREG